MSSMHFGVLALWGAKTPKMHTTAMIFDCHLVLLVSSLPLQTEIFATT